MRKDSINFKNFNTTSDVISHVMHNGTRLTGIYLNFVNRYNIINLIQFGLSPT